MKHGVNPKTISPVQQPQIIPIGKTVETDIDHYEGEKSCSIKKKSEIITGELQANATSSVSYSL